MDSEQGNLKERLGAVLQAMKVARRPGIDLLSGEDSVEAFCGCALRRGGHAAVALTYCGVHAAALEMFGALNQIAANEEHDSRIGAIARAVLAKAEGK